MSFKFCGRSYAALFFSGCPNVSVIPSSPTSFVWVLSKPVASQDLATPPP
jgi:hypothetical protein